MLRLAEIHERQRAGSVEPGDSFADAAPHAPAAAVARHFGIRAPTIGIVGACATGTHAIIRAAQMIKDGQADLVLAGACEASIHPLCLAAFDRMGVLARCSQQDRPETACRPFDIDRTGFALGEGAGMLVLESACHASKRGARPLAAVAGWALAADPTGIADLDESGGALAGAILTALQGARLEVDRIDYINAHGTGTRSNDVAETRAIRRALGAAADTVAASAIKGSIGHLLGAAGAVETAVTVMAMRHGQVPPTVNLEHPDPLCDLDYVPGMARRRSIRHALKTSIGFGGHIGVIVLRDGVE